jgi:hypothetical protein
MITRRELMERVVRAERDVRHFCADDVSREAAAVALAMYSPMVEWRRLDADAAAEVTELVLARFSPAEPPAVPGLDWLPGGIITADAKAIVDQVFAGSPGAVVTAAAVNAAAQAVAVLDEPAPRRCRQFSDKDGELWNEQRDGSLEYVGECEGPQLVLARGHVEREYGPLVEVTP